MSDKSKITSVEAVTARVPLDKPVAFATRLVEARDYTLVRVTTDDGLSGIGFCYGGHRAGDLPTRAVVDLCGPVVLGEDSHRVEGLWQAMYQEGLLHGRAGAVMRAIGAVDIALWDRNARAAGLPLHSYLGGYLDRSDGVPAYASGGYYLEGKSEQGLADEVASYVDEGFFAVKIKVGRLSAREDAARVKAAREAIGPDVLLMLDANNAWRDVPSALQHMRRYEDYDPYWIEEPFTPDDIRSHAELARKTSITVATGEVEVGRWRHLELLSSGGAGILQTDAAVCGGITEWRRIAHAASCFGVAMSPHWFHDLHVHLVAASENGEFVELFPDDSVLNFRHLLDRQLVAEAGRLPLPSAPGLGFEFDSTAVARFALGGWQASG